MAVVDIRGTEEGLSALLDRVEQGEEVTFARHGRPVTRLVRVKSRPSREPGSWRRVEGWRNFRYDPALFAPMSAQELAEEGWP